MLDPVTALAAAASAVSNMKTLINAGRDTSQCLMKFASAWTDISEADRRARNPSFIQKFNGSMEENAARVFATKKRAQELKTELESMISFVYGPSGLKEYKETLRSMREHKRKTEYRKAEIQRQILEWTVGVTLFCVVAGFMGIALYLVGKSQGRW